MKKRNIVATASLVGLIGASTFALAESNSVFRYPVHGAKASSNIDVEIGGEETTSSNITSPTNVVFTETGDQLSANVGDSATITIKDSLGNQLGQTTSNSEGDFTSPLNPSVTSGDVLELTITNGEDTIVANITVPEGIGNTLDPEMVAMCKLETNEVKEDVVFPSGQPIGIGHVFGDNSDIISKYINEYELRSRLATYIPESIGYNGGEMYIYAGEGRTEGIYIAGDFIMEWIDWYHTKPMRETPRERLVEARQWLTGSSALIFPKGSLQEQPDLPNLRADANSVLEIPVYDLPDYTQGYFRIIFEEEYNTGVKGVLKERTDNYDLCVENGYETAD